MTFCRQAVALAVGLAVFASVRGGETPVPPPGEVARRIAEQFLSTRPDAYQPEGMTRHSYVYGSGEHVHYSVVTLWVTALECARLSGDAALERRLVDSYHALLRENPGVFHGIKHVDYEVTGALPLEVAILTGDREAARRGLWYADRQWEKPTSEDNNLKQVQPLEKRMEWWKAGYSSESRLWLDDMYMMSLLQLKAYRLTGDAKYLDRTAREMVLYLDRLPRRGSLYFHAPDAPYAWARGNGWMAAAMAMVLREIGEGHPCRAKILAEYRSMMAELLRLQRKSGLWGQLVDDAESWDETSGSAMFAYAIAEGVRCGWLGAEYAAARDSAYAALVSRLDDHANLSDVCVGTGARNNREWYMNRARINGDPHGQAPLLWLCAALMSPPAADRPQAAQVEFHFADTNRAAVVRSLPLLLRDGVQSLEISPEDVPDGAASVEITHPWARASAGDRGWWVLSDGMYGEFEQGKDATYTEWRGRVMQVWGFSSPRGAIAAIHRGLRYEAHYHVERKDGRYRLYDRYDLGDLVGGKMYSPIAIDYHVLPDDATYVDVARAYKAHQLATRPGLKPLRERILKSAALAYAVRAPELRIRQAWKPVPSPVGEQTATNEPPMTVAITFDRVRDIVHEMKRQGIGEATITLVGWNIGGHDGRFPQIFPVESRLGGEEKLRELIVCAKTNGYWIVCHNNYSDAYSVSSLGGRWMPERYVAVKGDGTYRTGGTWGGGRQYFTCLGEMLSLFADEDYARLRDLGFAGLHYTDCLSLNEPLTCHAPGHPATKEDYAASALALMRKGGEYFGGQASEGGFDHVIERLDYCMYLSFDNPGEPFKSPLVKKHVPLWNLVYNGYVLNNPYCASTNYTRKKPIDRVKLYETAGRPLFYFHSKFTSNGFNWMGSEDLTCETDEALRESVAAIKRGYDEFAKCRDLQLEEMSAHRELAPGVTESAFSDGTRILANCTGAAFTNEAGTVVAPMDYVVARPDVVLLEAEDFAKRGGWCLDTQFVHKMGSAYLLAASAGRPVKDAVTTFEVPHGGRWTCWARTKDWIPEHSPGRFVVAIDGRESDVLGASGKSGWMWERAGEFELATGRHEARLIDKTGYFARCDAVLFAADPGYVPPERSGETLGADCEDGGEYDVVVVGAGTAGMAASVAAARAGARTALVQDRPVLGGNASSEFGVGIHGASYVHPNSREGGLIEEARLIRLSLGPKASMSDAYRVQAAAETNLAVRLNERVLNVEKDARRISAVFSKNTLTGKWTRYRAKVFIDCTGDGWLGYYAGVPYRKGREGRDEFGEAEAPDVPDATTMSGVLMADGTWCFRRRDAGYEVRYETPVWARVLPKGFTRKLKPLARGAGGFGPVWWIEHSGDIDDFEDPEGARDMLVRISFAYFGWGKNEWEHRDLLKNDELVWVPYKDGRRETLRLMGAYLMTANDQKEARVFPDRISYGGWPMDTHDPLGMMNPKGDGFWKNHPNLPVYTIPYRVLYSPALDNFFFAGRCQSVTHMALGSVRLMSTVATLGQACGTAAAECVRLGLTPEEYGTTRIAELQQRLLKDDQYIPGLRNEDPADIARTATVTASSSQGRIYFRESPQVIRNKTGYQCKRDPSRRGWRYAEGASPKCVIDGVSRIVMDEAHAWVSDAAQPLPQWIRLDLPALRTIREVRIVFNSDLMPTAPEAPMPPSLAKAYCVEVLSGGEWRSVADVADNTRRLRVHAFAPMEAESVRITVKETCGAPEASVFEVRIY